MLRGRSRSSLGHLAINNYISSVRSSGSVNSGDVRFLCDTIANVYYSLDSLLIDDEHIGPFQHRQGFLFAFAGVDSDLLELRVKDCVGVMTTSEAFISLLLRSKSIIVLIIVV